MKYTQREVLQFIEENDVKFVKLMFCDIFGALKNISVISGDLRKIFDDGLLFDASKFPGFMNIFTTDLVLHPDPDTLNLLPWRPQQGRVVRMFCNITYPDGTPFEGDGRNFLKNAVEYARKRGYNFQIGTSCEFYVFHKDENDFPTKIPHDHAGCCDAAPMDKGENLRRDICLTLEQMEIYPESSRHENGPGQNEIDFQCSGALKAADNLVTFKNVVKSVADRNGLYATFMPKPLYDRSGSGLHILLYCMKGTENIFRAKYEELLPEATSMVEGLLKHIGEMTLFLNNTTNSFQRLGTALAPKYVSWAHENYNQLLRVPLANTEENGITLRSPDNASNPYFALGLIIYACIEGVEQKAVLREAVNVCDDGVNTKEVEKLPMTLNEAIESAEKSDFLKKYLSKDLLEFIIAYKKEESLEFAKSKDREIFETVKYFNKL